MIFFIFRNILLTQQGKIKLTDMGIAKEHIQTTLNGANSNGAGTVSYMSPEMFENISKQTKYSLNTDVWFDLNYLQHLFCNDL